MPWDAGPHIRRRTIHACDGFSRRKYLHPCIARMNTQLLCHTCHPCGGCCFLLRLLIRTSLSPHLRRKMLVRMSIQSDSSSLTSAGCDIFAIGEYPASPTFSSLMIRTSFASRFRSCIVGTNLLFLFFSTFPHILSPFY